MALQGDYLGMALTVDELDIEIVQSERHAKVVALHRHHALRITMADPVPGIAHPRLAVNSTSLTCRHPPSR